MIALQFNTFADLVNFEASQLMSELAAVASSIKVGITRHSYRILPPPPDEPPREAAQMKVRFPDDKTQEQWLEQHREDTLAYLDKLIVEGARFDEVFTRKDDKGLPGAVEGRRLADEALAAELDTSEDLGGFEDD